MKSSREKELRRGFQWAQPAAAIILGAASLYLATWTRYDLITFLLGTFSIFCVAFVFVRPYEYLKTQRKARSVINKVDNVLHSGVVDVAPVTAKQIALAKGYEDEGDLYIVEMEKGYVLYIWDIANNLKKSFPCFEFEVYSEVFFQLIGRVINPLSEKITPIIIDSKAKWNYFKKAGAPEHLTVERKNFQKLIEKINNTK